MGPNQSQEIKFVSSVPADEIILPPETSAFVGIAGFSDEFYTEMADYIAQLKQACGDIPVNWHSLHKLHTTVFYFRKSDHRLLTAEERIAAQQVFESVEAPTDIDLEVDELNLDFENHAYTMWLKMKPHEQLEEYHRKLEAAAVAAGFEPHQFPSLQMHVTLARVKPNRAELGRNAIASVDGLTQQCSGFITPAKAGFFQKGMWGEEKAFRVDYATPELNRDI